MSRADVLLVVGLIGSCLLLVNTAYETRRLFSAIERAKFEERQLDSEHKRLEAERQVQSTHLRVERVARERLQMRTVTPAVTHWVNERPTEAATAAQALPAAGPLP
ncbi:MAG: cell division protein FtsL [Betaproteobacteria bacterium]|jgi:cell division protein FtsL